MSGCLGSASYMFLMVQRKNRFLFFFLLWLSFPPSLNSLHLSLFFIIICFSLIKRVSFSMPVSHAYPYIHKSLLERIFFVIIPFHSLYVSLFDLFIRLLHIIASLLLHPCAFSSSFFFDKNKYFLRIGKIFGSLRLICICVCLILL